MSRLRHGTNRAVLLGVGAVLLVSGAALASATGLVRDRLPARWPRPPAGRTWLDGEALGRWRDQGWWPALVIAALCAGVLLFLWWGWAQVRAGRLREMPLGQPGVTLSGPALAAAMAERAEAVDGVARAQVTLLGRPRRLRARVTLVLAPDGRPEAVLRDLARRAVTEVRAAAAPRSVEVDARLTVRQHKARRLR
ncbi:MULTISPECIES: alkaline shock response membrane anchor protein AmaP [Streptomyces]|uniref:alkaline shock response membrane anchor protein AmaP n=1 Tax=Streptomyces TaxID=1883 RepID=UPI001E2AFED1|nr:MULTISPECIES: alkaline shock response membrane anchor protein AmaP [Streptomyces]UFQ13785.1 alkaline shock response membrane anchor protein AmaP [Streptomyces huasconensis]WCL83380.1 alkaline shock response membrane anchor protein AmaP [Streptomyces sp. JCM 35825]